MRCNPYKDHLKIGRSQLKRLESMRDRVIEMSDGWDDVDHCIASDLGRLANQIEKQLQTLDEMILAWREGHG